MADRTACKRIHADVGEQTTKTTKAFKVSHGPTNIIQKKVSTTMCSSTAERLCANHELHQNDDMAIPMRDRSRMRLAPEAGGGRVTAKRTAPKLNGIVVDPTTTSVIKFAELIT